MDIREWKMKKIRVIVSLWVSICCGMILAACGELGTSGEHGTDHAAPESVRNREEPESDQAETLMEAQQGIREDPGEVSENEENAREAAHAAEERKKRNEEKFYETAMTLDLDREEAKQYYERLCEDNVLRDGTAEFTCLLIEDLDGNGQKDMIAMVQEGERCLYGEGCIYFYMNEDPPYCFRDDDYPFLFELDVVTGDFDDDGNTEIVFESRGTGNGAAGDWHLRILKYKDHSMEKMDFPSESCEGDDREIHIKVTQEMQADTYSAYCPYLDETITFEAENIFEPKQARVVGGNVRGYYNICSMEYEGRDALVVAEYLCGEGGNVHCVGEAKFMILWEKDGSGRIVKWWIDH